MKEPSHFRDHFSGHAPEYRAYRPDYPPESFRFLAEQSPGRELAWDCGTGNGQAAISLAEHFHRVFATDGSPRQLAQAPPHPRIQYAAAPADACPLPDHCADLVLVAQALHWFDLDRFYREARRVGRAGAVIAATTYYDTEVNGAVNEVLERFKASIKPHWPAGREHVDSGYRTIPFPFEEIPAPEFPLSLEWNLARFLGYLGTWSASREYLRAVGRDPVQELHEQFTAAWGSPETVRTVRWKFAMCVGRLPASIH